MRWVIFFVSCLRGLLVLGLRGSLTFLLAKLRQGRYVVRVRSVDRSIVVRGRTSDLWVLNTVLICEEYRGLSKVDALTIVDAGANIGCASVWFKRQYPCASIIALEPDPENYSMAVQNTCGLTNVHVLEAGLWGRKTRLRVTNPDAWKYSFRVEESPDGPIQAESVISILDRTGWSHIDILKMDIEGAESSVLGADIDLWINRVNVLIIELHQNIVPECGRLLCNALAKGDFRLAWKGEDLVATRIPLLMHPPSRDGHG